MKITKTRWMLVDDNQGTLNLMGDILEMMNCAEIVRFNSPTEALEAFAAAPEEFQVVITDLEMPDMNGIELCRRIHTLSRETKVLLASGSSVVTEVQALQWG